MRWTLGQDPHAFGKAWTWRSALHGRSAAALTAALPIVLFVAAATLAMLQSRRAAEQTAQHEAQNLAIAVGDAYGSQMGHFDVAIASMVAYVEGQLAKGDLDLQDTRKHLHAVATEHPELDGIRMVDETGRGLLGPGLEDGVTYDFSDRQWFKHQRDHASAGLYMSEPLVSKTQGLAIVSLSRRIHHPDGRFAGVVTAAVPIDTIQRQLMAIDPGPGGAVVIRDAGMRLVARWPAAAPGSSAQPGTADVSAELRRLLTNGTSRGHFATDSIDGTARTVGFARVNSVPGVVIVALSRDHYLQAWRRDMAAYGGLGAALLLLYLWALAVSRRAQRGKLRAERRTHMLAEVFQRAAEAIVVINTKGRVTEANSAFERLTEYSGAALTGHDVRVMVADRTPASQLHMVRRQLLRHGQWKGDLWIKTCAGRVRPVWLSIVVVRDDQGKGSYIVISAIETSELRRAEKRILHMAHHDPLTHLPNRASLQERLSLALAFARRDRSGVAVMFIDLDRFKHINDTLGHQIGDLLLIEVARRLRSLTRASDIVARIGGDEFVLALTGLKGGTADEAGSVAEKVRLALCAPYQVRGIELHTTASIGLSRFPLDGDDSTALMRSADMAMYHAKSCGRNRFEFFEPEMNHAASAHLAVDLALHNAVEAGQMAVHYQPQVRVDTGAIVAAEALLRWRHPTLGLVAPTTFIPIAEDNGLISQIGHWVLTQALAQCAVWRHTRDARFRVAVNVSAVQLYADDFVDTVLEALVLAGLPGDALELEITESTAMRDPERSIPPLTRLRSAGVRLAIDDFGTGYSSLAYLKRLPLAAIKLDRSFVMDLEHDANDAAICRATVRLAHSLGLMVTAEGVETQAQLQFLHDIECDLLQGYLLGEASSGEDFAAQVWGDRFGSAARPTAERRLLA